MLPLVSIGLTSIALYIEQRKEWSYHLTPFYMTGILAAALLWIEAGRALTGRRALRRVRFDLVALPFTGCLAAALACAALSLHAPRVQGPLVEAMSRLTAPGARVLVLSITLPPAYPALTELDRLPGSRYLWDFAIPFYAHESGPGGLEHPSTLAAADERRFRSELYADIDRFQPRLIAVNTQHPVQGRPVNFDFEPYLERAGIIDRILADYEERPGAADLRVFVRRTT